MNITQFSRTAKALADPRRFEILEAIAASDESDCSTLVEQFPISQATVSHHLKELANADLITVRREGQHSYYHFCPEVLKEYTEELLRRTTGRQPETAKAGATAH